MTIRQLQQNPLDLQKPERYLRQRHALIRFFEWNGAPDPEDLADEVICRLLSTDSQIENPLAFLYGVAQNVLSEHRRERRHDMVVASELERVAADPFMTEALARDLDRCLECLSRGDRSLIRAFYAYEEGRKASHRANIARKLHLTDSALRIRVSRIRKRLASCLEQRKSSVHKNEIDS